MRLNHRGQLVRALRELNKKELKYFYAIVTHYWVNYRSFISEQNFLNLWCEASKLCHEVEENFPDIYEQHKQLVDYCKEQPYYFIDILDPRLSKRLFCRFLDKRLDVLAEVARRLKNGDIKAIYAYINEALGINKSFDRFAESTIRHVEAFS
jgi:hypothetical protein